MDLRKKKLVATLVFPLRAEGVLLGMKTDKIGKDLWNGWGGEVKEGESIREAAQRELGEESGLSAKLEDFEYVGKVTFHNQKNDGRKFDVEVHMFLLRTWSGEPKPNSEMRKPTFWPISALPYEEMMVSDRDWLPHVLAGEWIEGEVWHGLDQKTLVRPTVVNRVDKLGGVD